jgi:hypothetical protein
MSSMQTDKQALTEIVSGIAFSSFILGVFVLFIYGLNGIFRGPEVKPEDRFRIVDQYGPCEVVRYAPKNGAEFVYFLDCKR